MTRGGTTLIHEIAWKECPAKEQQVIICFRQHLILLRHLVWRRDDVKCLYWLLVWHASSLCKSFFSAFCSPPPAYALNASSSSLLYWALLRWPTAVTDICPRVPSLAHKFWAISPYALHIQQYPAHHTYDNHHKEPLLPRPVY